MLEELVAVVAGLYQTRRLLQPTTNRLTCQEVKVGLLRMRMNPLAVQVLAMSAHTPTKWEHYVKG